MDNYCIMCTDVIPEGRQVCRKCEAMIMEEQAHETFTPVAV